MHVLRHIPLLALCLLVACGSDAGERVAPPGAEIAPFTAQLGGTFWAVPDRPDLYQATFYKDWTRPTLNIRVCYRRSDDNVAGCEDLDAPLVNSNGVATFIRTSDANFSLIGEKPEGAGPPPDPLITISGDRIDTDIMGPGEAYELGRIRLGRRVRLSTTDRGWPIVSCTVGYSGSSGCGIGFWVGDAFVEAHVHAEDATVQYNQAEVWAIASALDAKLRELDAAGSPALTDQ